MRLQEEFLFELWDTIPVGKLNGIKYKELCDLWGVNKRQARAILHELSIFESGDDFVLIRSCRGHGFYKTQEREDIEAYKREIYSKALRLLAILTKINRVLKVDEKQLSFEDLTAEG